MLRIKYIRININMLMVLFTVQVFCDSKAIGETSQLTRVLEIVEDATAIKRDSNQINCEQLPPLVLAELLGEAYNSRYMSINWPVASDDIIFSKNGDSERNAYTHTKRKTETELSFYVDDKYVAEVSDKPAWDMNLAFEIESKMKHRRRRSAIEAVLTGNDKTTDEKITITDSVEQTTAKNISTMAETNKGIENIPSRNKRAYGRASNADSAKKYPWKCESSIRWIDLGPDYFPRYLRTVECTKHYCWYKAFVCKAKSFAIKILRRRQGMCADASNLRKLSAFDFRGEYGEVWKWEEVAINFCCDCAIA